MPDSTSSVIRVKCYKDTFATSASVLIFLGGREVPEVFCLAEQNIFKHNYVIISAILFCTDMNYST